MHHNGDRSTVLGLFILALVVAPMSVASAGTTRYADADARPGGDGLSWATAFASVQEALNATQTGDTLYSRGVFHENVQFVWGRNDITWIGDSDPERPTWMRGDRSVSDPALWAMDDLFENCLVIDDFTTAYGMEELPDGVVYDYQRDDVAGSVTGIPIIRPWYGHLLRVDSPEECDAVDGSWYFYGGEDRLLVNPPGEVGDADPSLITAVVRGRNAVLMPNNSGLRISGVNTMLTPTRVGNNGYGFKGNGQDNIVENAIIVDSGWHAAGFAIQDSFRNTLRNITVYGGSVPGSFNINNPFVFYSAIDRSNSECVGEDLTFYAYPILLANGRPAFLDFNPRFGYSHAALPYRIGGIDWRRCLHIDFVRELEQKHGITMAWEGSFINAGSLPSVPNEANDPSLASQRVYDSLVIGPSARPGFQAHFNTVFDRRGFPQLSNGTVRGSGPLWLVGCVFDPGRFNTSDGTVFTAAGGAARYYFDATTIVISDPNANLLPLFRFGAVGSEIHLRSSLIAHPSQGTFMQLTPTIWNNAASFIPTAGSALSGFDFPIRHTNSAIAPRTAEWWLENISPDTRFDLVPEFTDLDAFDLTPAPGSDIAIEFALPIYQDLIGRTINDEPYFGRYGHAQTPFDLDINADGVADIEDLYTAHAPEAGPLLVALRQLLAARLRDHEAADIHQ